MPTSTVPLKESASVILDSEGNGSCKLGPRFPGVTWTVSGVAVMTSTNKSIPQCRAYFGDATDANFLGGTENGSRDSFGPDAVLTQGKYLTAVWAGGDAGATATMTFSGQATRGVW